MWTEVQVPSLQLIHSSFIFICIIYWASHKISLDKVRKT